MTVQLDWKIGFEIELMAPRGKSRRDLAEVTAKRVGGVPTRFFHPESEYSTLKESPIFENLTLGFRVEDEAGEWTASFIDDLTLQADCEREATPKTGWYRLVSDDGRILRLAARHCDASAALETVLDPLAALFGTVAEPEHTGMIRVSDETGASIAIGAPLPGERERPCEIVTAPISSDHQAHLGALLEDARRLGFTIPHESATHIHFDAEPLCSAKFIARFVPLIRRFGAILRQLVGANPNCVRLGQWPDKVDAIIAKPDFLDNSWDEVRAVMLGSGMTKYCDFNLVNMINRDLDKHTLEVRILPGIIEAETILEAAALFEALLRWCAQDDAPLSYTLAELIAIIPLQPPVRQNWLKRAEKLEAKTAS